MNDVMMHRTPIPCAIDPVDPDRERLGVAAGLLREGLLVAYPTDTLYGLAADPHLPTAVNRLFDIKGRSASVAIPLIAADVSQVESVATLTRLGRRLASTFWPGPLSLVLDARSSLSRRVCGGGDTVAVRVPDHPVARGLAAALGSPITATSANRSGEPPALSAVDILQTIGDGVAMLLDGGDAVDGVPSTIIDARGADPILLRAGQVSWDRVLQSLA
jgi:L-threonylcarbamoyladenylate synthase